MIPIKATHVSGVVISKIDGIEKMLLLKRVKGGYWCHVAGGIEAGEAGWQTILRELKEETLIDQVELHTADFLEQFYEAKITVSWLSHVLCYFVRLTNQLFLTMSIQSIAGVRLKKLSSWLRLPISITSMNMYGSIM